MPAAGMEAAPPPPPPWCVGSWRRQQLLLLLRCARQALLRGGLLQKCSVVLDRLVSLKQSM